MSIRVLPVRLDLDQSAQEGTKAMHPHVDVITLGVADRDRTRRFYEDGLGLPVGGESALALRPWDELAAEAGVAAASRGFRGFTMSYIVEDSGAVDTVLANAVQAGGTLSKPTRWAFWGYSGYVTDPSGCLWKVASPKRRPLLGGGAPAQPNGARPPATEIVLTIAVGDVKHAKAFYAAAIGWEVDKNYGKFVSFDGGLAMYRRDALAKDAAVPEDGDGFRGVTMTTFVDTAGAVDEALDAAERGGGTIVGEDLYADLDGHLWRVAARA